MTDKPWSAWTDHQLRTRDVLDWSFAGHPLPAEVDTFGRLLVLDTVGCMLAGRVAPEVIALEEQFSNLESGPFSFPQGRRLSLSAVCAVGAMAATWDEACEGHALAHGRPGVPIIAALLPLALTRDTRLGPFMDALVAGYEIGARAGAWLRIRPGMHVDANWPALGVAAAVAHLLGLDAEDAMSAVNIAACQLPTSLYLPVTAGSVARNTYLGHAAWLGSTAALSAQAGITAPADALGFYADNYSAATPEPLVPSGRRLFLEGYLKPYAAVRHVHYGIEAARQLRDQLDEGVEKISRITLKIYPEAITYCGNRDPQTPIQAQFSLSYGVAAALRFGTVDPAQYRKERFNEPELRRLEKLVRIEADEAMGAAGKRGATLTVESGYREDEVSVATIKGDAADPMTQEEVAAKFLRYAAPSVEAEKAYHFAAAMVACTPDTPVRQLWDLLF
ncbi:MAG TPA: MmgE/PrpD family protein [Burkholderiales bacterium]